MKNKIIFTFIISFASLFVFNIVSADTAIHLDVETSTGALYNQDIIVTPCDNDNAGTIAITAYCAILQSGLANDWSWFGSDAFLSSLGGLTNDFSNNIYWGWFANLELGQTALNKYTLVEGDYILINYNINPLKISVDNNNPQVGDTIVFTVTGFSYDSSFNPTWIPAPSGKISINTDTFDLDSLGQYQYLIPDTTPLTIKGQATGFLDTTTLTITPTAKQSSNGGGGSSGGGGSPPPDTISIPNALTFLSSHQNTNGSFGDMLYTDWAAIALARTGNQALDAKQKVTDYLKNNVVQSSIVTDNERHAMALMSLGINPYSDTNINYISKITSSFDGTQFGDNSLINDDIFALIVLKNAEYTSSDDIINKDVAYIISHQLSDGSWGSVDMTAAGIQALNNFTNISGVPSSIDQALNYLNSSQAPDGGFGNSFSTSWVLQALSENSSSNTQISKADQYLATQQQTDGGLDPTTNPIENRIWSTSYAIVAALHLPWNSILQSFSKPTTPLLGSASNNIYISTPNPVVTTNPIPQVETIEIKKPDTEILNKELLPKTKIKKVIKKVNKQKNIASITTSNVSPPIDEYNSTLSASAAGAISNGHSPIYNIVRTIVGVIMSPFRWLWVHLGF